MFGFYVILTIAVLYVAFMGGVIGFYLVNIEKKK